MKVVTFGEIMLRLAPEGYLRFVQAEKYEALYGGGEANVSVSLANYGLDSAFVTKLPAHEIGQGAVNSLRKFGVDTSTRTISYIKMNMGLRDISVINIKAVWNAGSNKYNVALGAIPFLISVHKYKIPFFKINKLIVVYNPSSYNMPVFKPPSQCHADIRIDI